MFRGASDQRGGVPPAPAVRGVVAEPSPLTLVPAVLPGTLLPGTALTGGVEPPIPVVPLNEPAVVPVVVLVADPRELRLVRADVVPVIVPVVVPTGGPELSLVEVPVDVVTPVVPPAGATGPTCALAAAAISNAAPPVRISFVFIILTPSQSGACPA